MSCEESIKVANNVFPRKISTETILFWNLICDNYAMEETENLLSQNFAIFDNFFSTDLKTWKLFKGLIISFGPTGKHVRMCDSMC